MLCWCGGKGWCGCEEIVVLGEERGKVVVVGVAGGVGVSGRKSRELKHQVVTTAVRIIHLLQYFGNFKQDKLIMIHREMFEIW